MHVLDYVKFEIGTYLTLVAMYGHNYSLYTYLITYLATHIHICNPIRMLVISVMPQLHNRIRIRTYVCI